MIFTAFHFIAFLAIVFTAYWLIRNKTAQNLLLLIASYIFYGFVHPWFCILIATSSIVDYLCGLALVKFDRHRRWILASA